MAQQQAQATGTLGGTPVANLLIYVLDRKLTGTLVIEDPAQRKSAIAFVGGSPTKVRLPEPVALLSEVLVGMDALDQATSDAIFQTARLASRLHGQELVSAGVIEPNVLSDALAEQVARKVEWLCALPPESRFGYYDGRDLLQSYGGDGASVESLGLVWRALRLQTDPAMMDATLARLGTREVRLHAKSRVGRFGFTPRERGVVDVLRAKPQPLPDLVASELLPEPELKRILYALVVTRHLDLGGGAAPVGVVSSSGAMSAAPPDGVGGTPVPSVPPTSVVPQHSSIVPPSRRNTTPTSAPGPIRKPTPPPGSIRKMTPVPGQSALRTELPALLEKLPTQNHYQVLGVDPKSAPNVIQSAFFGLAKRWHPDRLGPDVADLREACAKVFARMSEANRVLCSEELRKEYDANLVNEAEDEEQIIVQRILKAASSFQKAEVLAKRGNIEEAGKHAADAVRDDPEQAEYVALHADILSQAPDRTRSGSYADVVKMVNDAKKQQPDNMKVRLYRARVLKRAGDLPGAHREFRAIVEQDAHNVEAAREVRLYEMRRGKSSTDPKRSGTSKTRTDRPGSTEKPTSVFDKFFKR